MKEIDILIKKLKPAIFSFIIIKSFQTEQAISLVKSKIKASLPNRKAVVLKTEGKDYRSLMDFIYANAGNIILFEDFDKLIENKEVSIGFNQRRDKLADLNLAILAFVADNKSIQNIMSSLPDLWSFRSSIIELEFEPLQKIKTTNEIKGLNSNITYIEHNRAKKEYKTIVKRIKELDIIEKNLPLLNTSYIRLFDIYYSLVKYNEGLGFAKKLHKIADQFDYKNKIPKIYANILHWLGIFYSELGKYNNAIDYYNKALAINVKIFGKEHPDTAGTLNNLGNAWHSLSEHHKAIDYYNKALAINVKIFGEEHPDTASCLNNLGNAWHSLSEHHKAIDYYNKALAIDIKTLGEEHPNAASCLNNLGNVWHLLGEHKKAMDYYNKAEKINIKFLGANHPNIAITFNNLGEAWYSSEEYKTAIDYYQKALTINIKIFGEEHPNTSVILNNLGNAWHLFGEYKKAMDYYNKAEKIWVKFFGEEHPYTKLVRKNIKNSKPAKAFLLKK